MLASLLTLLLGKGAEALLMHAKVCNLPNVMLSPYGGWLMCVPGLELRIRRCGFGGTLMPWEAKRKCSYLHKQNGFIHLHLVTPLRLQLLLVQLRMGTRMPDTNTKARQWRE